MKLAFVGVRRPHREFTPEYLRMFSKFHLEIPWYYAELGGNDVTVTTVDLTTVHEEFTSGGRFRNMTEAEWVRGLDGKPDVVVHWRKWFPEFYLKGSLNVIHTCDHSYSREWKESVWDAFEHRELYGLDCYPTWHQENTFVELEARVPLDRLLAGFTFGVDTEIYSPMAFENTRHMLWSSDPGRGLNRAIALAIQMHQKDKRYVLHVCHPDYVKHQPVRHPAIVWHGNVPNGPRLWDLFKSCGILPYTSTFREPSSRAFRQAQAAGSLVLYPPDMGSPSRFIRDGVDGFVRNIGEWEHLIVDTVNSYADYDRISAAARAMAESESWTVQAQRFNERIGKIVEESR